MKNWLMKFLSPAGTEAAAAHAEKPDAAAYRAFDAGELAAAAAAFGTLTSDHPHRSDYAYMLGLARKYQRDWIPCLEHNAQAVALSSEAEEGANWNAAIAATALGRWRDARRHWAACGIAIEPGDDAIEKDYGTVSLRLNPWSSHGETLYAERIDPARAYLMNVPLPESGYRFRDLVLHDGAKTGERMFHGRTVPVFNVLQRLQQSDFVTYAAFVSCPGSEDCDALQELTGPGIGLVEDWSGISYTCLRCSYGAVHAHKQDAEPSDWDPDRIMGVAAQSRIAVERLLAKWEAGGNGRYVDAIEQKEHPLSEPVDGTVWWRGPADD